MKRLALAVGTGLMSRMIILDDQARQQMTLHFQLSLQCNVSPITGFVRHTASWPDEARDDSALQNTGSMLVHSKPHTAEQGA